MVRKGLQAFPTVGDRVVQAAAKRILEPIFEEVFLECSFGFRPGRKAHMALEKIHNALMAGYNYVIDADLKSYFDTIPHEKLITVVREEVVDGSVPELIRRFLQSGVIDNGSYHMNEVGTMQGGGISPLLANIPASIGKAEDGARASHNAICRRLCATNARRVRAKQC